MMTISSRVAATALASLLLMGSEDIDQETFKQSMSIIVKHRTDIDLVAERVGMKLPERAA